MKRPAPPTALAVGAAAASVILTGIAFWLSYEHLHDVADSNGLDEARAWAWPATVDLFIVVGETLMLSASLKRRVDWWGVGLATLGSLGSIALNVAGVGDGADAMQYVVAAVPPSAALVAFGAVMRQLHQYIAARNVAPATAPQQPAATPAVARRPAAPKPAPMPVAAPRNSGPDPLADAIEEAMALVDTDLEGVSLLTVADVASLKGVREGTVRSWVSRGRLAVATRDANGRSHFHPNAVADLD